MRDLAPSPALEQTAQPPAAAPESTLPTADPHSVANLRCILFPARADANTPTPDVGFSIHGPLRRCGSLCHAWAVSPHVSLRTRRAPRLRGHLSAHLRRECPVWLPTVRCGHVGWAPCALGCDCPTSDRYGQPLLPVAALSSSPQPHAARAGWAESSDPAPALTSPPRLSVPTGDLLPTGYPYVAAGLHLPAPIPKSGLTDPVAFVPPTSSHLKACAGSLPPGCRPSPEPTSDHTPGFPAAPTVSTDAAPLPTVSVPRTMPTLEDILADDEFGAATSAPRTSPTGTHAPTSHPTCYGRSTYATLDSCATWRTKAFACRR